MDNNTVRICQYCHKKLRPIGTGQYCPFKDWSSRKYHLKCYKEITARQIARVDVAAEIRKFSDPVYK